jgi:hypothetical protein
MRTKSEIRNRIELLRDAFAWSLETNQVLTVGQRICLNQERAALLRSLASIREDDEKMISPAYILPEYLNDKVNHIKIIINTTMWQKSENNEY